MRLGGHEDGSSAPCGGNWPCGCEIRKEVIVRNAGRRTNLRPNTGSPSRRDCCRPALRRSVHRCAPGEAGGSRPAPGTGNRQPGLIAGNRPAPRAAGRSSCNGADLPGPPISVGADRPGIRDGIGTSGGRWRLCDRHRAAGACRYRYRCVPCAWTRVSCCRPVGGSIPAAAGTSREGEPRLVARRAPVLIAASGNRGDSQCSAAARSWNRPGKTCAGQTVTGAKYQTNHSKGEGSPRIHARCIRAVIRQG